MPSRTIPPFRGVVLPSNGRVEGLDEDPAAVTWLGLPLAARQERAFLGAGLRPGPDDPSLERIIVSADAAVTSQAVRAMGILGRTTGTPVRFLPGGELGSLLGRCDLGRKGLLAAYVPAGFQVTADLLEQVPTMELDPRERVIDFPIQRGNRGQEILKIPLADQLLFPMGHWLQVLWANLLGLGPFLWAELTGRTLPTIIWRLTWAAIRAGSTDPFRVGAVLGRRGERVRVHPRAVVEGSWLGDGVEIGANAVVRGCVLADGARVEDGAIVEAAVLGAGALVQRQAIVKYAVLSPRASVAGAIQLGVMGREASTKYGTVLLDMAPGQGVRVRAGGGLHSVPWDMAGVCVGPGTFLGFGVHVAPGRAIPGGLEILPPPTSLLHRIPEDLPPGRYVTRDGTLERP